jgi:hypothetical protein
MEIVMGNWKLHADAVQWIVSERKVAKTGKNAGQETWSARAYFHWLDRACLFLLERNLAESDASSLNDLMGEVAAFNRRMPRLTVRQKGEMAA